MIVEVTRAPSSIVGSSTMATTQVSSDTRGRVPRTPNTLIARRHGQENHLNKFEIRATKYTASIRLIPYLFNRATRAKQKKR